MAGLADYLAPGRPDSYITDLDPEFAGQLERFMGAVPGLTINSGARSIERQRQLWEQGLKKYGTPEATRKWVAPPGKSQHNRGGAVDLGYASDAARKMAHERAAEFGLTFPMAHENWHIEPIGGRSRQDAPGGSISGRLAAAGVATEAPAGAAPSVQPAGAAYGQDMSFRRDSNPIAQQSADLFSGRYGGNDLMQDFLSGTNPLRRAVMSRLAEVLM